MWGYNILGGIIFWGVQNNNPVTPVLYLDPSANMSCSQQRAYRYSRVATKVETQHRANYFMVDITLLRCAQ